MIDCFMNAKGVLIQLAEEASSMDSEPLMSAFSLLIAFLLPASAHIFYVSYLHS